VKSGGWTFTGGALLVSAGLGVLLIGFIIHLNSRAADQKKRFEIASADYETVKKLRLKYRELKARELTTPPETGPTQSWPTFLAQKAMDAGLPTPVIVPEMPSRGPLKESAFTVSLDGGANGTVSRKQFVKFMDLVESQRPGFKSKTISFKFSTATPDDFHRASATFSHFER